tara:strand:- start:39 stop:179 length:141 start_codon:yes stop_codon:yes gene_type:complete
MEDGRWNWYGVAEEPEEDKKEEDYPKGWFWCSERKDYFRYKEWLNL